MHATPSKPNRLKFTACALLGLLPSSAFADWSGAYAGLAFGALTKGEATAQIDGENLSSDIEGPAILGGFIGYQTHSGPVVYGGELEFGRANNFEIINEEGAAFDRDFNLFDLKARIGHDVGDALIYGVVGASQVKAFGDFDGEDTAQGYNFGLGVDYKINDQFVFGAEYLARRVSIEDDSGFDVDFETLTLRAAMHF